MSAQYAKAIAAAIGAGLTAALSYYPHASWIPIASAICTLLATYAIPNVAKPPMATGQLTVPNDNTIPAEIQNVVSQNPGDFVPAYYETFNERVRA